VFATLAMALAAAGCGGDEAPDEDPGAFVRSVVAEIYAGDSATAWEGLHPRHQEAVPRSRYVQCERLAPLQEKLRHIEVVGISDSPSTVPGDDGAVDSKAVEVTLLVKLPEVEEPQEITHTVHVFAVDGRWTWVIGPNDFASYASGRCPSGGQAS
jgi:hypothetical protein